MSLHMVDAANAARDAQDLLKHARQECHPILRTAVGWLSPPLARMAGYHFGWWDTSGFVTDSSSGKSIRSALTLGAAAAFGGESGAAAPAAAAVELMHNFSLVHDDVMDKDATRRGRPTVWAVWGEGNATLLGDALHALASRVLAEQLEPQTAVGAIALLESSCLDLCAGQFDDCDFENREKVSTYSYLQMVFGKTASLMGCACALGALTANADAESVSAMQQFGHQLGIAFQLVDDVVGLWGNPQVTGKPVGNDLARRKKTFPVIAALDSDSEAATQLAELYRSNAPMSASDVKRAIDLVESAGGREAALRSAEEHVNAALTALPDAAQPSDLIALAQLVRVRDR